MSKVKKKPYRPPFIYTRYCSFLEAVIKVPLRLGQQLPCDSNPTALSHALFISHQLDMSQYLRIDMLKAILNVNIEK
jgi:hypothetical protein